MLVFQAEESSMERVSNEYKKGILKNKSQREELIGKQNIFDCEWLGLGGWGEEMIQLCSIAAAQRQKCNMLLPVARLLNSLDALQ